MVKFVIDSASDIEAEEAAERGLVFLPMQVTIGEEIYRDGIDISKRAFYEKLIETDELPKTSQISPFEFEEALRQIVDAGDEAVVITISSKLSGTYQSAMMAASSYPGKVFVVDSLNACIGEQVLVRYGMSLAEQGMGAAQIAESLDGAKGRIRLLALLDTLEYLKKGGRISAVTAFAGGILSIKPVIAIENGEVAVLGKARGSKQGNNLLMQLVEKTGGIDYDMPFALAYTGTSDDLLRKYLADSQTLWQGHRAADEIPVCCIGSTIGTHAGPGAIALSFFSRG